MVKEFKDFIEFERTKINENKKALLAGYQKGFTVLNYKLKNYLFRFWLWGIAVHMHIIQQHITILFEAKFIIFVFFLSLPLSLKRGAAKEH